jgi:hypothetical protein
MRCGVKTGEKEDGHIEIRISHTYCPPCGAAELDKIDRHFEERDHDRKQGVERA